MLLDDANLDMDTQLPLAMDHEPTPLLDLPEPSHEPVAPELSAAGWPV